VSNHRRPSPSIARYLGIIAVVTTAFAGRARAQAAAAGRADADSVFARARQLVARGNGAAGRVLIDSVVAATSPDSPQYADALYWRAMLSATSADAERDYRQIVVDYPASRYAGDALYQLAQLEVARGDRAGAAVHLDRFLLENPRSPEHTRAGLQLVRILFDQNDLPHACSALRRTLASVPDSAVETRNQLQYYSPRCMALDANPSAQVPVVSPSSGATVPGRDSVTHHDSTARKVAAHHDSAKAGPEGRYTLQVAAYESKAEAERLAAKLKKRGLDARVDGAVKLFRVHIGRYHTRSEAAATQKELKRRKIDAFITEVESGDT
jgi:cell division septation protein DedD